MTFARKLDILPFPGATVSGYIWSYTRFAACALFCQICSTLFRGVTDGGATWIKLNLSPSICGLTIAPSQADRLYARRCNVPNQPPVYRSNDGGQNWIIPSTTLTQTFDTLIVAPNQPDILIAANFEQVFRSTDGGNTWTTIALGRRYGSRPIFDPSPPYTLYLGHWTGLLRSLDAGITWQDSGIDREFATLIVAPDETRGVLGGNQYAAWQFQTNSNTWTWSAESWDAPLPLLALWRSTASQHVIYALSKTGLWRQR